MVGRIEAQSLSCAKNLKPNTLPYDSVSKENKKTKQRQTTKPETIIKPPQALKSEPCRFPGESRRILPEAV